MSVAAKAAVSYMLMRQQESSPASPAGPDWNRILELILFGMCSGFLGLLIGSGCPRG